MIYSVIDTNVLISALLSKDNDTATVKIYDYIFQSVITPVYHTEILEEYMEVLSRPKFNFSTEKIHNLLDKIIKYGRMVLPISSGIVLPDMDDLIFLEVLLGIRKYEDAFLITGNKKHFPEENYIVSPREMIQILERA